MKIVISESQLKGLITNQEISEEITSGSFIVYHRTGKHGDSPVKGIASDGYRVGVGAMYGVGVYTTYNLKSQLSSNMRSYGNIVIESKILSINGFLIFDYDVAKRIYGKNYRLNDQIRLILGNKEWKKYENDQNLKHIIDKIGVTKYTSDVAISLYNSYPDIISKLRGIVFTGSNDGNVLVSYDRANIEPIRYTTDNGETWVNVVDKNIYGRIRGYKPEERSTEYQHIINKLDVGRDVKVDDFKKLPLKVKNEFVYNAIKSNRRISDDFFNLLPVENKKELTTLAVNSGYLLSDVMVDSLTPEEKIKYIFTSFDKNKKLTSIQNFKSLPEESQIQYVNIIVKNNIPVPSDFFEIFPYSAKRIYIKKFIRDGLLSEFELKYCTPEEQMEFVEESIKAEAVMPVMPINKLVVLSREPQLKYLSHLVNTHKVIHLNSEKIISLLTKDMQIQYVNNLVKYRQFTAHDVILDLLVDDARKIFIENKINALGQLSLKELKYCTPEQKTKFINKLIEGNFSSQLPDTYLKELTPELQKKYLNFLINNKNFNYNITPLKFNLLSDDTKTNYIENKIKNSIPLTSDELKSCTPELQEKYVDYLLKNNRYLEGIYFKQLIPDLQKRYAIGIAKFALNYDDAQFIGIEIFKELPNDIQVQYAVKRIKNNKYIDYEMSKVLPDEMRAKYIIKTINENEIYGKNFVPKYEDIESFSDDLKTEIVYNLGMKGTIVGNNFYKSLPEKYKMIYCLEIIKNRDGKTVSAYLEGLPEKNQKQIANNAFNDVVNNRVNDEINYAIFKLLPEESKIEYLEYRAKNNLRVNEEYFKNLSKAGQVKFVLSGADGDIPSRQTDFIKDIPEKGKLLFLLRWIERRDPKGFKYVPRNIFNLLSEDSKKIFAQKVYDMEKVYFDDYQLFYLTPEMMDKYVLRMSKEGGNISSFILLKVSPEVQNKAAIKWVNDGYMIDEDTIMKLPKELQNKLLPIMTEKGYIFSENVIKGLPQELQKQVKDNMNKKGWGISLELFKLNRYRQPTALLNMVERNIEIPKEFIDAMDVNMSFDRKVLDTINKQLKNNRTSINESYDFKNLSDNDKDQIYDIFKISYEKSLGSSWSKDKFYSRAQNWLFFGDMNGFIAVRPQKSGFYKLVGVGGNLKSILSGLDEIKSLNIPVWGMVSSDIQKMVHKKDFKTPPAFILKVLYKVIPDSVFGGVDFDVNSDGSLTMKYQDVGDSKKYFIGNEEYFKKLKSNIFPSIKDKLKELPLIVRKGVEMFFK